jgi:aminoglycoside phosphotransferase family enzyme/predicted kinase
LSVKRIAIRLAELMSEHLPLIRELLNPAAYPHAVGSIDVVETHISWVLLTGQFAYKIKKPVRLDFVDFSTLERRQEMCLVELRLNRRFAPRIYLDVVPVCKSLSDGSLNIGGSGEPIEYAVKMVQFPAEARLDRVLARAEFGARDCDLLAARIADVHIAARVAELESMFGTPAMAAKHVGDALNTAMEQTRGGPLESVVAGVHDWAAQEVVRLRPAIEQRKAAGRVRECHGDLHSENIAVIDGEPTPFDCLEFREDLRWIDAMSDVGFLCMDLEDRGHARLAYRLLNTYLERTGDIDGLGVLRFYQSYRAVVRGLVSVMQQPAEERASGKICDRARTYFELAERYTRPRRPSVVITHGVSGTGKSTLTQELLEEIGAIRLRSDLERQRGADGLIRPRREAGAGAAERYAPAARQAVYDELARRADVVLAAGYPVIVDATFLRRAQREAFRQLAERRGAPYVILAFDADPATLRQRIESRQRAGGDASEATIAVLEQQLAECEPPTTDEQQYVTAAHDAEKLRTTLA